jgi:hypothetical protein
MFLKRWLRRLAADDESELDGETRAENEKYRAQHDSLIEGRAQPAADRSQRRTDDEFKPPSY